MLVSGLARQRHHFDVSDVSLDNCVISHRSAAKNLGVTIDSTLSFDRHIKEITKIAFLLAVTTGTCPPSADQGTQLWLLLGLLPFKVKAVWLIMDNQ